GLQLPFFGDLQERLADLIVDAGCVVVIVEGWIEADDVAWERPGHVLNDAAPAARGAAAAGSTGAEPDRCQTRKGDGDCSAQPPGAPSRRRTLALLHLCTLLVCRRRSVRLRGAGGRSSLLSGIVRIAIRRFASLTRTPCGVNHFAGAGLGPIEA